MAQNIVTCEQFILNIPCCNYFHSGRCIERDLRKDGKKVDGLTLAGLMANSLKQRFHFESFSPASSSVGRIARLSSDFASILLSNYATFKILKLTTLSQSISHHVSRDLIIALFRPFLSPIISRTLRRTICGLWCEYFPSFTLTLYSHCFLSCFLNEWA